MRRKFYNEVRQRLGSVFVSFFVFCQSYVLVVASFPRGCVRSRDCDISFERELVVFVRTLRAMVQEASTVPSEYDFERILKAAPITLGPVPQAKYTALFAQYFRYDVLDQQTVFYREVQLFLSGLCEQLLSEFQTERRSRLTFLPYDPVYMVRSTKDRLIDSFLDCCAVLTQAGLLSDDLGAVVVQQYHEVSGYFIHRWKSQSNGDPAVDDVISLWLSYPHWTRCVELLDVIQIVVCAAVRSTYICDFVDTGSCALTTGQHLSCLNLVRSWASCGVFGGARRLMSGFLRHCETTDLQVSRLTDRERCRPWDQLLKVGLGETLSRCSRILQGNVDLVEPFSLDTYRSSVCAQLMSWEAELRSPKKVVPADPVPFSISDDEPLLRGTTSASGPRLQKDVEVLTASTSKSRGVSSRMSPAKRNRGKRARGKKQSTVESTVCGESSDGVVVTKKGRRKKHKRVLTDDLEESSEGEQR